MSNAIQQDVMCFFHMTTPENGQICTCKSRDTFCSKLLAFSCTYFSSFLGLAVFSLRPLPPRFPCFPSFSFRPVSSSPFRPFPPLLTAVGSGVDDGAGFAVGDGDDAGLGVGAGVSVDVSAAVGDDVGGEDVGRGDDTAVVTGVGAGELVGADVDIADSGTCESTLDGTMIRSFSLSGPL